MSLMSMCIVHCSDESEYNTPYTMSYVNMEQKVKWVFDRTT